LLTEASIKGLIYADKNNHSFFFLFQDIGSKAEAERITMYRCIIASIIESETAYLECLKVMLQVCGTSQKAKLVSYLTLHTESLYIMADFTCVNYEMFIIIVLKIIFCGFVFWVFMPCSSRKGFRCFGGTYYL
jgi:hypothetical protein